MSSSGLATYAHEVTKHPNSERTFTLNLTDWLAGLGSGVTIEDVTWDTTGFTPLDDDVSGDGKQASVKLGGGVVSLTRYPVVGNVTTSNGEVQPFTFLILVAKP